MNRRFQEHCSKNGAERIAKRIRAFWEARGKAPKVWTEMIPGTEEFPLYQVRSNMKDGLPQ